MRLIDADDLILTILTNDLCGDDNVDKAILNAPTVKAIPIEWIMKKLIEADNTGMGIDDWSAKDCYRYVLEQWEKENEK